MELQHTIRGEGPEVLLIHGIMNDRSHFSGLGDCLEDRCTLISYDRRGYGDNPFRADDDFSVSAQAEDAAELLRSAAKGPVFVIAHSAGSMIALELADRHPDLVTELFLIEPLLTVTPEDRANLEEWNAALNKYRDKHNASLALAALHRKTGPMPKPAAGASGGSGMPDLKKAVRNAERFLEGELNEIQMYDFARAKIAAPVTVGVTEIGEGTIFGKAARNAAEAFGWPILELPGSHDVIRSLPEEFAAILTEHWPRLCAG